MPTINDVSTFFTTNIGNIRGGLAFDSSGDVYLIDNYTSQIYKISGGSMSVFLSTNTELTVVYGMIIINNTFYVCDRNNYRIVSIDFSGNLSVIAGGTYGNADGNGTNAQFAGPTYITSDTSGNLYITDTGGEYSMVRKIDTVGNVTTIARGLSDSNIDAVYGSITCDNNNNLYVSDPEVNNIYKITQAGDFSIIANSSNGINGASLTVDSSNNLYGTNNDSNNIFKITTTDNSTYTTTIIAGSSDGEPGYQDGNGTSALFNMPRYIKYNSQKKSLFLIDQGNQGKIRELFLGSPPVTTNTTTTTTTTTTNNIDFVLDTFNGDLQMTAKALLDAGQTPETIVADAVAVYEVTANSMQNAFYFESDSRDLSDNAASDIKYYVNWPSAYVLNPAHAYVNSGPIATTDADGTIPDNRLLVKHDFIRHIAKSLFNTHLGVDLFSNEAEVVEDLASKGHAAWTGNIKPALDAVSAGGNLVDPSGGYMTNALDTSANLCKVLFKQMTQMDKSRFAVLDTLAMDSSANNLFCLPFKGGDSISFKVVVHSDSTQQSIIDGSTPVPARSYRIKLKMVDAIPSNVVVDDGSFTTSRVIV